MSSRSYAYNGFAALVASDFGIGATTLQLDSAAGLTDGVGYLVIDWDDPANIEWIKFTGKSGNTLTGITRNLVGSSGDKLHGTGAKVRQVFTAQHLADIFTDIETLEAADTTHATDTGDPHSDAGYLKQVDTDALYLALTGGTLSGALTLAADPTLALQAATKQYVDNEIDTDVSTHDGLPAAHGAKANSNPHNHDRYLDSEAQAVVDATPLLNLVDVTITTVGAGEVLVWDGAAWVNQTLAEAQIASLTHNHDAGAINTGVIDVARLPDASTSAQGVVQLSNVLTEASTVKALTANQGKNLREQRYGKSDDPTVFDGRRIFIQSTAPTMSNGDIWFDTSP